MYVCKYFFQHMHWVLYISVRNRNSYQSTMECGTVVNQSEQKCPKSNVLCWGICVYLSLRYYDVICTCLRSENVRISKIRERFVCNLKAIRSNVNKLYVYNQSSIWMHFQMILYSNFLYINTLEKNKLNPNTLRIRTELNQKLTRNDS